MSKPRQVLPTVMTRRKVAQLNTRQLRNKDASKKKIAEMTQMLRRPTVRDKGDSPGNIEKSSSKSEKSPNKNVSPKQMKTYKGPKNKESPKLRQKTPVRGIKIQTPEKPKEIKEDEYYPNKIKRCTKSCKVVLKPIHGLKIGSKRKVAVPQKGLKPPSPKRIKQTHNTPTIQEIIELSEQQGLSDEDFLEILTCESPVWWEDPPDNCYDEDAICIKKPILHRENANTTYKANQQTQSTKIETLPHQIPEIKRTDNKFMTKRSKLENLLGNIKNKLTNKVNINNNTIAGNQSESKHAQNDTTTLTETKPSNQSFLRNKLTTSCSNKQNNEDNVIYTHRKTKSTKTAEVNVKTSDNIDCNKSIVTRTSESIDGEDALFTFEENDILNDLENMDIPLHGEGEEIISDKGKTNSKEEDNNNSTKVTETFLTSNGQINNDFLRTNNTPKCENMNLNNVSFDKNKHQKQGKFIDAKIGTIDNKNKTRLNKSTSDIGKNTNSDDFILKTNPSVDRMCTVVNTEDNDDSDIQKLTITSIEKISSPTLSDVDNSSCQEFDTISESNLKFPDEDISSLNSEYSSSDGKNLNDHNGDTKEICRENMETGVCENELLETSFIQNEKDFESVEKITKIKNQKNKDKEYMTVYKIISCEDVTDNIIDTKFVPNDKDLKNIQKSDVFKKIISENEKSNEKTDSFKSDLNSFYKKCKSTYHRKPKSSSNNVENEINKIPNEQQNSTESDDKNIDQSISIETEGDNAVETEGDNAVETEQTFNHDVVSDTFCRSCETSEKSIVISDQNIVKYCLKCSCIFESENCTYCDKKAEIDKKKSTTKYENQ